MTRSIGLGLRHLIYCKLEPYTILQLYTSQVQSHAINDIPAEASSLSCCLNELSISTPKQTLTPNPLLFKHHAHLPSVPSIPILSYRELQPAHKSIPLLHHTTPLLSQSVNLAQLCIRLLSPASILLSSKKPIPSARSTASKQTHDGFPRLMIQPTMQPQKPIALCPPSLKGQRSRKARYEIGAHTSREPAAQQRERLAPPIPPLQP